jgi:hypothetical protein
VAAVGNLGEGALVVGTADRLLADVRGVAVVGGEAAVGFHGESVLADVVDAGVGGAGIVAIVAVDVLLAAFGGGDGLVIALVVALAGDFQARVSGGAVVGG